MLISLTVTLTAWNLNLYDGGIYMSDKPTVIYVADVSPLENEELFNSLYSAVSEERRGKTDRMRREKDKRLSLGAEYLLMRLCRDCGIDYGKIKTFTNEYSKPDFADCRFHFNISHSGSKVMCAVSPFEVGCDTEKMCRRERDTAKRFFTDEECRIIGEYASPDEKDRAFFRLWTLKESFMKCTGFGFHLPLNAFSVDIRDNPVSVKQSVDNAKYIFSERDFTDGYAYSLCLKLPEELAEAKHVIQWEKIEIEK